MWYVITTSPIHKHLFYTIYSGQAVTRTTETDKIDNQQTSYLEHNFRAKLRSEPEMGQKCVCKCVCVSVCVCMCTFSLLFHYFWMLSLSPS